MALEGDVATLAVRLFGDPDQVRAYLKMPNFALGGMTPMELLQTEAGKQLVLNELQAHLDGGPV
ncbi:MbcA/ParS/Xre antitoxin family protein [uncultured Nevskia sp.]|uniref:MbcA/ParS/Xre antitoxin family protein n=1 Tax=uncultured Nevskia sp. TaxID=228950 RepID=UPI0025E3093C|nr:MbcA/ParS/Xre antitoxin family protein [uncultured Nevskia sp.]